MTCDAINAEQAYRLNLANKIVKSESLGDETKKFIKKIASKSPTSIRITKKIVQGASMAGFGNMLPCEPELMQGLVYTGETNEGISAFLNGKPPKF